MSEKEAYKGSGQILVAADNAIFGFDSEEDKLKVLLFERQVEPQRGKWSLVGSFIRPDESGIAAAKRILKTYTGIEISYLEQFRTYSAVERDPGARVISIAFYSLIRIDEHNSSLLDTFHARWFALDEIQDLALDHEKILKDAFAVLQDHARLYPIGFNLLPDKFTLPKLLKLYQALYQTDIDDRNFRKNILSANFLIKLNEKDKSESKKGAWFYEFDKQKYFDLVKKGYSFKFLL